MSGLRRAAVLCPGPSLAAALELLRRDENGPHDTVIGVNRAATAWPCDYWSILDHESFAEIVDGILGRPTIITVEPEWEKLIAARPDAEGFGRLLVEDLAHPPRPMRWHDYSATIAIVAAWTLGAKRIVAYGADLAGQADWDGQTPARANRDAHRWERELAAWAMLNAWLYGEGVRLQRWLPPPRTENDD